MYIPSTSCSRHPRNKNGGSIDCVANCFFNQGGCVLWGARNKVPTVTGRWRHQNSSFRVIRRYKKREQERRRREAGEAENPKAVARDLLDVVCVCPPLCRPVSNGSSCVVAAAALTFRVYGPNRPTACQIKSIKSGPNASPTKTGGPRTHAHALHSV